MKRLLTAALIAFYLVSTGVQGSSPAVPGWTKYRNDEGKVSIKFPAEFDVTVEESETATTYQIISELGKDVFMLSFTFHETEMDDPYNLAQVSLESFNEAVGGELVKETDYKYEDYKGREAIVDLSDAGATVYYRVVIIGQIQYQLAVVDHSGNILDEKDKFFNSFSVATD